MPVPHEVVVLVGVDPHAATALDADEAVELVATPLVEHQSGRLALHASVPAALGLLRLAVGALGDAVGLVVRLAEVTLGDLDTLAGTDVRASGGGAEHAEEGDKERNQRHTDHDIP